MLGFQTIRFVTALVWRSFRLSDFSSVAGHVTSAAIAFFSGLGPTSVAYS